MRIVKINEQQYRDLFLNETMHYPKFLDKFKSQVAYGLHHEIDNQIKQGIYDFTFILPCEDCEYTDSIFFDISIKQGGNINEIKEYPCYYLNDYNYLQDGKLIQPKIIINCPSQEKHVLFALLDVAVAHELTHLYDDWNNLKNNKYNINSYEKNVDTTEFAGTGRIKPINEVYKYLSALSYMSLKVERQAFLSQTVQELQSIGCTLGNYKKKLKETSMYNNLKKGYNGAIDALKSADSMMLYNCNDYILSYTPKANIPKMNLGDFNYEQYRQMLLKWVENVYHESMKYYGSVVQYYIDNLREQHIKMNDFIIF